MEEEVMVAQLVELVDQVVVLEQLDHLVPLQVEQQLHQLKDM